MEKLIRDIKQWGLDRGIDKCDPLLQTTKTLEECMELQRAIIRYEGLKLFSIDDRPLTYRKEEKMVQIMDSIGDTFITLVMIDLQAHGTEDMNLKIKKLGGEDLSIFGYTLLALDDIKKMQNIFINNNGGYFYMLEHIVTELAIIAGRYDLTLKDCVEFSYNEIKDRKGRIIDGLWEKDN